MTDAHTDPPRRSEESRESTRLAGVALAVFLVLLAGLAGFLPRRSPIEPAAQPTLDERFSAALDDVMEIDPDPSEVVDDLWALDPGTPGTLWDSGRVLVSTWTSFTGYNDAGDQPLPLARDVWVVPVPQVFDRCRGFDLEGEALGLRLRQYLGLGPDVDYDRVVELWVDPLDVFRPCPDAEVTDRTCRPGLPDLPDQELSGGAVRSELDHARWFQQQFQRYLAPGAAPWTRLGYTYDWGNPQSEIGASEFVIAEGSTVLVESITPTATYCTAGPSRRRAASGR
jgi:hypothetical protein